MVVNMERGRGRGSLQGGDCFLIDGRYDLLLGRKVWLDFDLVSVFWYGLDLVPAGSGIRLLDCIPSEWLEFEGCLEEY